MTYQIYQHVPGEKVWLNLPHNKLCLGCLSLSAFMFSGRVLRWIIVPFSALGILLAIYFRELFLHSPPSSLQAISLENVIWPPVEVAKPAPNIFLPAEDLIQDIGKPGDYIAPFRSHLFRDDGIVEVNPDGRHPIFELIDRAEARWQAKLNRASRSLEEAVREYKRRYRREPPKGFDAWCVLSQNTFLGYVRF